MKKLTRLFLPLLLAATAASAFAQGTTEITEGERPQVETDMPAESADDIADMALRADPELTRIARLFADSDLGSVFATLDGVTFFVPTDGAFSDYEAVNGPMGETEGAGYQVLMNHLVAGVIGAEELGAKETVTTMLGRVLPVRQDGDRVLVDAVPLVNIVNMGSGTIAIYKISGVISPEATR